MTVAVESDPPAEVELQETSYPAVEIDRLTARLGGSRAVRNLSLRVPHGSVYGLVGPSGAGKTALLRVLATLLPPDAGTARVEGIDVRAHPAAVRARVGYGPDTAGVYEYLTVREYLDFYAGIGGVPAQRRGRTVEEVLELINLTERSSTAVRRLSRGMRQQLALGRCLLHDPQVLLLDEPASGMDPLARLDLREILRELAALGKTVLLASSVLSEVVQTCTHLAVLRDGELVADGPMDRLTAGGLSLRVRLTDDSQVEAAGKVLERHPGCGRVERDGDRELVAAFAGTEEDVTAIRDTLAAAGIAGAEITLERPAPEEVLLGMIEAT